jgi:hypothetical protein
MGTPPAPPQGDTRQSARPADFLCNTCTTVNYVETMNVQTSPQVGLVAALEAAAETEHFAGTGCRGRVTLAALAAARSEIEALRAERDELQAAGEDMVSPAVLQSVKDRLYGELNEERSKSHIRRERDSAVIIELTKASDTATRRLDTAVGLLREIDSEDPDYVCGMPDDEPCAHLPQYAPCWWHRRAAFLASPSTAPAPTGPPTMVSSEVRDLLSWAANFADPAYPGSGAEIHALGVRACKILGLAAQAGRAAAPVLKEPT